MDRKPGRPRALTVEQIAQAALDDGVATFSMPSVARRLGVAHSGLYRYVADREALLQEAFELAALEVTWPDSELPWRDLLVAMGDTVWAMCDAHPGLDRATLTASNWSNVAQEKVTSYIATLEQQGFVTEDAGLAVEFVYSLAINSSVEMARLRAYQEREAFAGSKADIPKAYDNDAYWTGRGSYQRKLDVLLVGIAPLQMKS